MIGNYSSPHGTAVVDVCQGIIFTKKGRERGKEKGRKMEGRKERRKMEDRKEGKGETECKQKLGMILTVLVCPATKESWDLQ